MSTVSSLVGPTELTEGKVKGWGSCSADLRESRDANHSKKAFSISSGSP